MDPISIKADNDSEYDELNDEFEDEEEDPNQFVIREPLHPPITTSFSTKDLHSMIHESQIDIDPPYQRGTVWPQTKQVHLIDSIFRNFFIPPLVFAIQVNEDGEEIRQCVDGKQRLTSIMKFLDGQIPHQDPRTRKNFWARQTSQAGQNKLPVPRKNLEEFENKRITCVEYRHISPATERDIFQRVQLGVSLTAAEKLQAISSPYSDWIHDLVGRFISGDGGVAHHLNWDTKRGRDFQCLAQVVYCCNSWSSKPYPTTDNMTKFIDTKEKPSDVFKNDITKAITEFRYITSSSGLNFGFRKIAKRLAPVEFVFVGVLLYLLQSAPHERKAKLIYEMRTLIRQKFRDIRANTTLMKAFWEYIGGLPEMESSTPTKAGKRKKEKDDDDTPYRPAPKGTKSRTKMAKTN